jgi:hypothetical protein
VNLRLLCNHPAGGVLLVQVVSLSKPELLAEFDAIPLLADSSILMS